MNIYEVDRNGLVFITSKESKYKTNWEVYGRGSVLCRRDTVRILHIQSVIVNKFWRFESRWDLDQRDKSNRIPLVQEFEARCSLTFKHPPCMFSKLFPCVHPGMNLLLLTYFDRIFLWDKLARQAPTGLSIHSISFMYPQYFNFKFKIMIHFIWYLLLNYQQSSKHILLCIPFVELTIVMIETVRDSAKLILNEHSI